MPTVILLDVSLSMSRPVPTSDTTDTHTRFTIATAAVNTFLDYLSVHAKLEYVALISFSSVDEVSVPFTRDFDSIRNKLLILEEGDKTCIDTAFLSANQVVLNEWGCQIPVQIILLPEDGLICHPCFLLLTSEGANHRILGHTMVGLGCGRSVRDIRHHIIELKAPLLLQFPFTARLQITDGSIGVGSIGRNRIVQSLPLPPSYPAKIHVLPVVSPHDTSLQHAMPLYQKIVDLANNTTSNSNGNMSRGSIYCPDQLSVPGVITAMTRLCEQHYQEFWCSLKCGQLESRVQLFPAPQTVSHEGIATTYTLANQLHVIGFIQQTELGTPIAISKHLVIPQAQPGNTTARENYGSKTPTKEGSSSNDGSTTDEDMSDPSKVPNFCVLLHGALKVEGMAAIVLLGSDWWGTLSAWCEASRARRSCLLLSVLRPGASTSPWLGALDQLGPADDGHTPTETFPIRSWRSYSGGGSACAWARPHALLADVQKVLRHARKLPDKTQHLYKELNRLRRAAISLGFSELLNAVGSALERECAALPQTAPPECALQLAHAARALQDPRTALDIKHTLQPLGTNFSVTPMTH